SEGGARVADYRRDLTEQLVGRMLTARLSELVRRPGATLLGAGAGGGSLSRGMQVFSLRSGVQGGRVGDGLQTLLVGAGRVREFGFPADELERAKRTTMAFIQRAYTERDKTESGSFTREYLNYFLEGEPSPGIEYEYKLTGQMLPTVTVAEVSALARTLA